MEDSVSFVRLSKGFGCFIFEAHDRLRKVYKTSFGMEDFVSFVRLSKGFWESHKNTIGKPLGNHRATIWKP
jgi:hypothetical protein